MVEATLEAGPGQKSRRAVIRDSLGVGLAVGVSGIAFGGTAIAAGLSVPQSCVLSLLAFTGGSQYALTGAIAAGGNPILAAVGAVLLGGRNTFYGLRLSGLLRPGRARAAMAHVVIDETTAVALAQPDRRSARLGFTVTGITLLVLWNLTTLAGALGASALGDPNRYGLDVVGPAAFLALVAPRLKEGRSAKLVAGIAVLVAAGTSPFLPSGVPVLLAVLAVPLVMAVLPERNTPVGVA